MGRVWYTTRESVMDAFDIKEAAQRSAQVDNAIASACDDVDAWLNRHKVGIAPTDATRYFAWPARNYSLSWRLWLDENELLAVEHIKAAGAAMDPSTYFLEPVNSGPPYTNVEVNLGTSASFNNSGTNQRAIEIKGTWGLSDDRSPAGTLQEALDASETDVDVSDASLVGVGAVLVVDTERMLVTGRSSISTGVNLGAALPAINSARQILGISGGFHVGETILVGAERMKIVENDGTNLTVIRAYDGSVLAEHNIGDGIFAYRTLQVERGALGTVPASHSQGTFCETWRVPDLIRDLAQAEAITRLEQEWSAYGARVFSDEAERDSSGTDVIAGRGLTDIRKACARRYKRKFRKRAI